MNKTYTTYNGGVIVFIILLLIGLLISWASKNAADSDLEKVLDICTESGVADAKCQAAQKKYDTTCEETIFEIKCSKGYRVILPTIR